MDLAKPPTATENSKETASNLANNSSRTGETNESNSVKTAEKLERRSIDPANNVPNIESKNKEINQSNQTKEPDAVTKEPKSLQSEPASPQPPGNFDQIPERPSRGPDIELSGEMHETGFEHQQWLVQRGGQFVQLPEVLYHILEEANGQQTLTQIAQAVSEKMNRQLSLKQLQRLIAKKLIPKGLIVKRDGSVEKPEDQAGGHTMHSPLAVNMKMLAISPRFIEPATKILQYLYKPVVLIGLLGATLIIQGWLFVIHGIAQSTRELLYKPGFMLIMLAIIIATAAFHEFGHASALRYGGGKVRKMGLGIYLIYPAFYTDVSDNYRLGRWPRVRTDLGGFYFNLIFSLVIMGLYALTGQEFLLLAVLLADLEIFQQLLPFVRLDGYWALADLTGIPDFFSKMGPFLRTVLPLSFWKGPKLPNLKGWVKAVFALYILITIPLLAFLLFVMIQGLPRILATAWDSFTIQAGEFSKALKAGDILAMAGTSGQMVLLALPVIGLLYVLYMLGRKAVKTLWNWSKPTPARRVMGGLIGAGAVAFLFFLWLPQLPFANKTPGPAYAYMQQKFIPIRPNERGTIGDAFSDILKPFGFDNSGPVPVKVSPARSQPTVPPASASTIPPNTPSALPASQPTLETPPTPAPTQTTAPPPPSATPAPTVLPQVPVAPVKSVAAPIVATVAPVLSPVAPIVTTVGNVVATVAPVITTAVATVAPVITTVVATAAPVLTAVPLPVTPPPAGNLLPLPPTPTPNK